MAEAEDEDLAALRSAVLASMKTKKDTDDDDCDLEALRLAALKTKKQPSADRPPSPTKHEIPSTETICEVPPTNSPLQQIPSQGPPQGPSYRSQRNFTAGQGRPPFQGKKRTSNLIVIQTTEPENSDLELRAFQSMMVRPQDKWSGTSEAQTEHTKPEKPKVPARFSRFETDSGSDEESDHESDSESSKSDSSSSSEDESGKNSDDDDVSHKDASRTVEDKDAGPISRSSSPEAQSTSRPASPSTKAEREEDSISATVDASKEGKVEGEPSVVSPVKPDYTRVPPPACSPPRQTPPERPLDTSPLPLPQPSHASKLPPKAKSTEDKPAPQIVTVTEPAPQLKSASSGSLGVPHKPSQKPSASKPEDISIRSTASGKSSLTKNEADRQSKLKIQDRLGKRQESKSESVTRSRTPGTVEARKGNSDKVPEVKTGSKSLKSEPQKSVSDDSKPKISKPSLKKGGSIPAMKDIRAPSVKVNGTSKSSDSSSSSSDSSNSGSDSSDSESSSSSLTFTDSDSESDSAHWREKHAAGQERDRDDIERECRRRLLKQPREGNRNDGRSRQRDIRHNDKYDSRPVRPRPGGPDGQWQRSFQGHSDRGSDHRRNRQDRAESGRLRETERDGLGRSGKNRHLGASSSKGGRNDSRLSGNNTRSYHSREDSRSQEGSSRKTADELRASNVQKRVTEHSQSSREQRDHRRGTSREQTDPRQGTSRDKIFQGADSRSRPKEYTNSTDRDHEETDTKKKIKSITSVVRVQDKGKDADTSIRKPATSQESSQEHRSKSKSHSGDERRSRSRDPKHKSTLKESPHIQATRVVIKNVVVDNRDAREVIAQLKRKRVAEDEEYQNAKGNGKVEDEKKSPHSPTINVTFNEESLIERSKIKGRVSVHQRLRMPLKHTMEEGVKRDEVKVHRRVIAEDSSSPHLKEPEQKDRKSLSMRLGVWSTREQDSGSDVQVKMSKKTRGIEKRLGVWSNRDQQVEYEDPDDDEMHENLSATPSKLSIEKRLGVWSSRVQSPPSDTTKETLKERLGKRKSRDLDKRLGDPRKEVASETDTKPMAAKAVEKKSLDKRLGVWSTRTSSDILRGEKRPLDEPREGDEEEFSLPKKRIRSETKQEEGSKSGKEPGDGEEEELNVRIRRIREQNAAILKRKEEVECDKRRYRKRCLLLK